MISTSPLNALRNLLNSVIFANPAIPIDEKSPSNSALTTTAPVFDGLVNTTKCFVSPVNTASVASSSPYIATSAKKSDSFCADIFIMSLSLSYSFIITVISGLSIKINLFVRLALLQDRIP